MRVPKEARSLLRKRKPAEFLWPLETEPRVDGVYALEGEGKGPAEEQFKIVFAIEEIASGAVIGWKVRAFIVDDPIRLLPKTVGSTDAPNDGYESEVTDRVLRDGYEPELEFIDADTAYRFARMGRMKRATAREQAADD
jgi:hypothetical protein